MRRLLIPFALGIAILVSALTAPDRGAGVRHEKAKPTPARSLMSER
jgi:hypothetical protein